MTRDVSKNVMTDTGFSHCLEMRSSRMWLLLPQEAFWAVLGKPSLRTTDLGTVRAWDGVDVPRHRGTSAQIRGWSVTDGFGHTLEGS